MAEPRHLEIAYGPSADFFALWLDSYLTYSCANWDSGVHSLEQAQIAKLDSVFEFLSLPPQGTFLDIGCGWGSLLRRGSELGFKGHGLTPVESQANFVRDLGMSVERCRWQEWVANGRVDGLACIGSFEHFAPSRRDAQRRLQTYSNFFQSCSKWLEPGGRFYLQTICQLRADFLDLPENRAALLPISREFRGSVLPMELGEITSSAVPWFELLQLRSRRLDYKRTCETWLENLQSHEESALKILGQRKLKHYQAYLKACCIAFESRCATLYQMVFSLTNQVSSESESAR
jgi:cyclopropane-fatty-acyl-phospholipid synthase